MPKPISPFDLDLLISDSKIPLELISVNDVKLNPMDASVYSGFNEHLIGFNQVPVKEHGRLFTHCLFSNIGFVAHNGLSYVPVFLLHTEDTFFDKEVFYAKPYPGLRWIVLYHGQDNCSYGRRFRSESEAREFVNHGFKNGFESFSGKLDFYNS